MKRVKTVLNKFETLLLKQVPLDKLILFGSTARGDAVRYSDIDVVFILKDDADEQDFDKVSNCAWEVGFEYAIVIVPIVFTKNDWENGPERYSLLAQAVEKEGVLI